jgi:hypothetical protein
LLDPFSYIGQNTEDKKLKKERKGGTAEDEK